MNLQPYQEAGEEIRRRELQPVQALKTGANLAIGSAGTLAGGAALGKIIPFLNPYISSDLFQKGLNKINPNLGKFVKNAMNQGNSVDEVKDFIKGKISGEEKKEEEPTQDNRNIIEQYSPELKQFIEDQIGQGRSPLEAGALAQNSNQFSQIIKKLSQDHKAPWSAILESIYGGEGQTQPQQAQPQQQQAQAQPQQMQQPQQQQGGQGQQVLSQAIQQFMAKKR